MKLVKILLATSLATASIAAFAATPNASPSTVNQDGKVVVSTQEQGNSTTSGSLDNSAQGSTYTDQTLQNSTTPSHASGQSKSKH